MEMGSSGESNTKSIDASVGGLVWVRRRNGSWWPGRIMGLDELSENCLVSPKSGTPVKLLGREDASVDWYNLEKSKRVKAFRCGEYDECIEKAKASAANSSKKAVKYARREGAILHALEIENGLLSKDFLDLCPKLENACGEDNCDWARESSNVSHCSKGNEDMVEEVSTLEDNSNSTQDLSQSGLSFEESNHVSPSKVQSVQGKRWKTLDDSEDDGTETIKRMRGLEDLGMGVVTKRKPQDGGDLDIVREDSTSPCDSNLANRLSVGSHLNDNKSDFLSLRRKKPQVANVHEFFKRKNRCRPLTKVLESTTMVCVPVMCDELVSPRRSPLLGVSENKVSGVETNEPKRSSQVVSSESTGISCENGVPTNATEVGCHDSHLHCKIKENEISSHSVLPENAFPDTLFDVPFVGEEKHSAGFPPVYGSCSSGKPQVGTVKRQSSESSLAETVSLKSEGPIESGSTSSAAAHLNNIGQSIEKGTSKWKSKGKRKSRHSRKTKKQDLRKFVDVTGRADCVVAGGGPLTSKSSILRVKSREVTENLVESFHHDSHGENHTKGPKYELKLQRDCSLTSQRLLPHRQSRYTVHPKYRTSDLPIRNYCADTLLYDVNLEVKASYRPQHVPLVSLMSQLNGQAIVGHPLTVEVLADGSCDLWMDGGGCYLPCSNSELNDGLSRSMSDLEGSEMGCAAKPNEVMRETPAKHASTRSRRSPSKPPKLRKCGFMSKKTRKLSSLAGHTRSKEEWKLVVEKPSGPVIACIPLNVVFRRLNEAVNGST